MFLPRMRRKVRATRVDGEAGWMMGKWRVQRRVRTAWTLERKNGGNLEQALENEVPSEGRVRDTRADR